jgi:hypothetical protein
MNNATGNSVTQLTSLLQLLSYQSTKNVCHRLGNCTEKNAAWQKTFNILAFEDKKVHEEIEFNSPVFYSVMEEINHELFAVDVVGEREGIFLKWEDIPISDLPIAKYYSELGKGGSYFGSLRLLHSVTADLQSYFGEGYSLSAWQCPDNSLKICILDNLKKTPRTQIN